MRLFHIHSFKIIDLFFEQPTGSEGLYIDYKILKCCCGKTKTVLTRFYVSEKVRIPFASNADMSYIGLGTKIDLI